jgi:hypothetical protein
MPNHSFKIFYQNLISYKVNSSGKETTSSLLLQLHPSAQPLRSWTDGLNSFYTGWVNVLLPLKLGAIKGSLTFNLGSPNIPVKTRCRVHDRVCNKSHGPISKSIRLPSDLSRRIDLSNPIPGTRAFLVTTRCKTAFWITSAEGLVRWALSPRTSVKTDFHFQLAITIK